MATRFTGWPTGTQITLELEPTGWVAAAYPPQGYLPGKDAIYAHAFVMQDALVRLEQKARELFEAQRAAAVTS